MLTKRVAQGASIRAVSRAGNGGPQGVVMKKILLAIILAVTLWTPGALASSDIEASPFGMVVGDLLVAFHADEVPCEDGANDSLELCFSAASVGVSYLAERLTELVDSYEPAGLSQGEWRAANGVWAVTLVFHNQAYGRLEVYLAETMGAGVRGLARLVTR